MIKQLPAELLQNSWKFLLLGKDLFRRVCKISAKIAKYIFIYITGLCIYTIGSVSVCNSYVQHAIIKSENYISLTNMPSCQIHLSFTVSYCRRNIVHIKLFTTIIADIAQKKENMIHISPKCDVVLAEPKQILVTDVLLS